MALKRFCTIFYHNYKITELSLLIEDNQPVILKLQVGYVIWPS